MSTVDTVRKLGTKSGRKNKESAVGPNSERHGSSGIEPRRPGGVPISLSVRPVPSHTLRTTPITDRRRLWSGPAGVDQLGNARLVGRDDVGKNGTTAIDKLENINYVTRPGYGQILTT